MYSCSPYVCFQLDYSNVVSDINSYTADFGAQGKLKVQWVRSDALIPPLFHIPKRYERLWHARWMIQVNQEQLIELGFHSLVENVSIKYSTFRAKTTELADYISFMLLICLSVIYKLVIICSIAHKILVAMVTTFENTSLATAKLAIY